MPDLHIYADEEEHNVNDSIEADDSDEAEPAGASRLWIEHEVTEAHHEVKCPQGNHFIEQLHVVSEVGVERSIPAHQDDKASRSEQLESHLSPEELLPEDEAGAHYEAAREIRRRD